MTKAIKKSRRRTHVVALRLLKCPRCESVNIKTTGTIQNTPIFKAQRKRCRDCGFAFQANFD